MQTESSKDGEGERPLKQEVLLTRAYHPRLRAPAPLAVPLLALGHVNGASCMLSSNGYHTELTNVPVRYNMAIVMKILLAYRALQSSLPSVGVKEELTCVLFRAF